MIDVTKNYKTKNDREVRIYSVSGGGEYPVHGSVKLKSDHWLCMDWTDRGSLLEGTTSASDLVEVKPIRWINVYSDNSTVCHATRERADLNEYSNRIACVEVKEGDGL